MKLRSLARGGLMGLVTVAVEKGAALVLVVLLARLLGPDDYGRYAFVVAYLTLFQILADFGLEPILLRHLSQRPQERNRWLANGLALRLVLAALSAALAVVLVGVAAPGRPELRPLVALGAAGLLFVGQPGFRALLRAESRLDRVLEVAGATNLLLFALVGLALWANAGLPGILLAISVAHLSGFVLGAFAVRSTFRFRLAWQPPVWRALLSESWPVGANVFAVMLGLRAATVFLMSLRGPVDVGFLASSMRLAEALNLVAEGMMLAVFPVLARLAHQDPEALKELTRVCATILAASLLVVVVALSQMAPDFLGLLFGPEFRAAGSTLATLGWFSLLASLGTLYTNVLVAMGRQRILFALNAASAVGQIALQFVLVSRFGLEGAAVGVVLASAINHMVLCLLPSTGPWIRPSVRTVAPLIALAAGLVAVSGLIPGSNALRGVGLATVFGFLVVLRGPVGREDLARLRGLLQRG